MRFASKSRLQAGHGLSSCRSASQLSQSVESVPGQELCCLARASAVRVRGKGWYGSDFSSGKEAKRKLRLLMRRKEAEKRGKTFCGGTGRISLSWRAELGCSHRQSSLRRKAMYLIQVSYDLS